jgi:hypothetical protein
MSLHIGQKVRLTSTGEVSVIVWLWKNEQGDTDRHVAFFGKEFPNGSPKDKPYILRYYESSLSPVE